MSDKENTATSTEASSKGTFAMLHATTPFASLSRSKECTVFCGARAASSASPHPKSATRSVWGCVASHFRHASTGRTGHSFVCSRNPAWYAENMPG